MPLACVFDDRSALYCDVRIRSRRQHKAVASGSPNQWLTKKEA